MRVWRRCAPVRAPVRAALDLADAVLRVNGADVDRKEGPDPVGDAKRRARRASSGTTTASVHSDPRYPACGAEAAHRGCRHRGRALRFAPSLRCTDAGRGLDELVRAVEGAHNGLLDLEELNEPEIEAFRNKYLQLAENAREEIRRAQSDTGTPDIPFPS
jgi:hypothetical protein